MIDLRFLDGKRNVGVEAISKTIKCDVIETIVLNLYQQHYFGANYVYIMSPRVTGASDGNKGIDGIEFNLDDFLISIDD